MMLQVSIPDVLWDKINTYAFSTSRTKKDVTREALEKYFAEIEKKEKEQKQCSN